MITKANDHNFIHICSSCGNKREVSYNDKEIKITRKMVGTAFAAMQCECGNLESFTSATMDQNLLKVFCKLLLNEDQQ